MERTEEFPVSLPRPVSPAAAMLCSGNTASDYNQWPCRDPLLSPKVHMSRQVHTCNSLPRGVGQIDDGECSGSEFWADFHCPKTLVWPASPLRPTAPSPSNYWSFHCVYNLSFPESHVAGIIQKTSLADWLLSHRGGVFKGPPSFFLAI